MLIFFSMINFQITINNNVKIKKVRPNNIYKTGPPLINNSSSIIIPEQEDKMLFLQGLEIN